MLKLILEKMKALEIKKQPMVRPKEKLKALVVNKPMTKPKEKLLCLHLKKTVLNSHNLMKQL